MTDPFTITTLGECRFDSTVETTLFIKDDVRILLDPRTAVGESAGLVSPSLEMAGPRARTYFDPARTRVAVVTCGGLCPGLNDVIRSIVMVAWYRYGIRNILGIRYGYEGLLSGGPRAPVPLTPEAVADIHQHGGTILGSSRGPQPVPAMVDFLLREGVDILFTIGGDGTQRGAMEIAEELGRRSARVVVVGIPKTIDNDIAYTERTFGFNTAVAASQDAIGGAHMEAKGVFNGIGLVKLMGRESGFVAAHASLASSDVNLVLLPEAPFSLEKVTAFLADRLRRKAHAVIVAAEGAGQNLVRVEGWDQSGNQRLGDIGVFLKNAFAEKLRSMGLSVSVKYIDPSYMIRSVPANADDSVFCFQLAEHAVHAALSGRTAMVVALWNGHFVHVPIRHAVASRKQVDVGGLLWQSVLDNTGQPKDLL